MSHIYGLDGGAQEFVKMATKIATEVAAKNATDVDQKGRFPQETIDALAKQGFFGLTLPTSVGGKGQGPRAFCGVVEELAQADASAAMIYVMHVSATVPIAASNTLAEKASLLQEIASGKHLTTLALSEKGSRSNFWLPVSKLEPKGEGFTVNASKSWVTAASKANSYVSGSQKAGAKSPLESVIYLVKTGNGTVKVEGSFNGLGLRGNDSAPASLTAHPVKKSEFVSAEGDGLNVMLTQVLPWFAIGSAAMAHGLCRAAINATSAHLQGTGVAFIGPGEPKLRDLPNLRARISEMSVKTDQSRALLGYTLGLLEKPTDFTPLYVLQSRLAALQAAVEVTDLAMKTCGGAAFSRHLGVERQFRDARAGWVMAPTVDHLEDFIGKALTGLPLV